MNLVKMARMMNRLDRFYQQNIIPSLYFVSMWACMLCAVFLIFEDLIKSAGIVSAISLFYILVGRRNAELHKLTQEYQRKQMEELLKNAKSTEKEG